MTDQRHVLYRFHDSAGQLLYIGITLNPANRWKQHSKDKPWWESVRTITTELHPDRESVLAAECEAIIKGRPLHNVIHNRGGHVELRSTASSGYDSTDNVWTFHARRGGFTRTTDLHLYWEVDGTAMSDDWTPGELAANELLSMWARRYAKARLIPIYWSVLPVHETAPFQDRVWGMGRDFLTYFSWPRHANTGEALNWNALPVLDGAWTDGDYTKGGFFQQATGYKPAPLQPYVDIVQIANAAAMPHLTQNIADSGDAA